jgi:hypothetical protein
MPMIWLYVFLLDFLISFLCDPDLQCEKQQLLLIQGKWLQAWLQKWLLLLEGVLQDKLLQG